MTPRRASATRCGLPFQVAGIRKTGSLDSATGLVACRFRCAAGNGSSGPVPVVRGEVLRPEGGGGLTLAVKADARFTQTSTDAVSSTGGNLGAVEAETWLARAGIEGSRTVALNADGATVTPSFEVGIRLNGGDAETGMGADLGGGIAFADP